MYRLRRWWIFNKGHIIWRKKLYSSKFTVVDDWGLSEDPNNIYEIYFEIYKVFSISNGFCYQIKAPNILINEKKLFVAINELIKYLYNGGCPCYFRLKDKLLSNGMWKLLQ